MTRTLRARHPVRASSRGGRRLTVPVAAAVGLVLAALTLAGCASADPEPTIDPTTSPGPTADSGMTPVPIDEVPEIASLTWQQSQALPDFDQSAHTTDDPDDIEELREVLAEYGITGDFRFDHSDCEGGLTTWVTYETDAADEVTITANSCEGETAFESELAALVTGWRTGV
ncbi:hypothetical protein GCM10011490_03120 [Pseudoclavibacter endophyticus]|uniref:Uncharacterized protein n=1 Tax=Pseudoclavibacter endophyticus TaxID=1778590 RepID=A0A6H9WGS4_9MICO|nr:hypothetical protein [Pseudoclavibacter endophyticus]KAB1650159.1 hypothetical protein F8O04_08155 [Pseudoclavibacter endophyticus]GGA56659.1 hypothetical protein GCM10011490_03120 [Pseudoclavibacter endophyticus]